MKLASFRHGGKGSYGIVTDSGIIDLGKRLGGTYPDLRSLLTAGGPLELPEVKQLSESREGDYPLSEIEFAPVIPNPDKIICVGANYAEHRNEAKLAPTQHPIIFFRLARSQIGHEEPMLLPPESEKLDFEGEIAVIIGREGRRIPAEEAYQYIAGYSCYNDGSVRDWQTHTNQWGPGKNFNGTGAFGPWMVTSDEIDPRQTPLTLLTRLNGEVVQQTTTDHMIFSIPQVVNYVSTFTTLLPGDVIITGTPAGVGAARKPQRFMKEGDVVEVEVSGIGVLRNRIQSELPQ
jgi:2-keto-4-pentenoate hydratase/2-oxohepta-3-ene-1,7-dioic acid hydratase in catechol pathway